MKNENERAERIFLRIEEYHRLLANIYEGLVDRDFKLSEKDIKFLIMELRYTLKSIEDDDF
jgi:hypothetical protein